MYSKNLKLTLVICLFMILSLVMTACASATPTLSPETAPETAPEEEEEASEPVAEAEKTVFTMVQAPGLPDIDPGWSYSNDAVVVSNAYEGLTFYNPPGSEELISPVLATSWETSEDGKTWTFYLREGVKFHDGTDFNADAVKYSVERNYVSGGGGFMWDPVEEINVIDDYTVEFVLKYAAPLDLIAGAGFGAWIYSPTAVESLGKEAAHEWFNEGNSAGTGPYMIDSRERGTRLIMTRFDDYWGGWNENQFDLAVFEINPDHVVRQQMLEAGEADFTYQLPRVNFEALDALDNVTVYLNPSFQNTFGLINNQKGPTKDKLVRQAISYAFPYDDFINIVMLGQATRAYGPVPAGMWGHSPDLFQYTYNLAKAEELLVEAGYPGGGFDMVYTYATGDLEQQAFGELWSAELSKLGINMEVRGLEWESQWNFAMEGGENAQDVFVFYWWPNYITPHTYLQNLFHCEEEPLFNLGYYCNPEYDALIDRGNELAGTDREEATRLFIEAQAILIEDAAAMFMYDLPNDHVLTTRVKGFVDNPAYPHIPFVYKFWTE